MPKPNPSAPHLIEEYIASREPFARPIVASLHATIQLAHSELAEDWKWSAPAYTLGGKIICVLWGFKHHVSLTFQRGTQIDDWAEALDPDKRTAHTRRLLFSQVDQIDPQLVIDYVGQACAIEETELGKPRATKKKPVPIRVSVPPILKEALDGDPSAKAFFDQLAPSYRRDYCRWIAEAKREETRLRRLEKALAALHDGRKSAFM